MLEKMLNEVKDTNTTLANCMIIQCACKRYESAVAREMEEVLVSMPIGKPMRPKEIARMSKYNSCQFVTAMLRKLKMANLVMREEIPCEPFEIEVGGDYFDYQEGKWVNPRYKTIDKVAVYTRIK
jgi:DNA-binding HxlR family transcriptional regulator